MLRERFHRFLPDIPDIPHPADSERTAQDALNASLNTPMGMAIHAVMIILHYEKDASLERDLVRKAASGPISNRVAVAISLPNLKNYHPDLAREFLRRWDENRDLPALQFAIHYFYNPRPEEIPEMLNYLERWILYVEEEAKNPEESGGKSELRLPHNSLSVTSIKYLLELAETQPQAREILDGIFAEGPGFSLLRIEGWTYIRKSSGETLSDYRREFLKRLADDPFPEVRAKLISGLCRSNWDSGLVRKLTSRALEKGIPNGGMALFNLRKYLENTWKEAPCWAVEILEKILIEKRITVDWMNLNSLAGVLKSIYLYERDLQERCAELLQICLDLGWDGLEDLYGLGRD